MHTYIKMFEKFVFVNEKNGELLSYEEIIDYIIDTTPNHSDIPNYFIKQLKESKPNFKRKYVKVNDVIKNDEDVKEYVLSGEDRYIDDYKIDDELNLPIVIFNDEVIDGYSRLSKHYRMGIDNIIAYISI